MFSTLTWTLHFFRTLLLESFCRLSRQCPRARGALTCAPTISSPSQACVCLACPAMDLSQLTESSPQPSEPQCSFSVSHQPSGPQVGSTHWGPPETKVTSSTATLQSQTVLTVPTRPHPARQHSPAKAKAYMAQIHGHLPGFRLASPAQTVRELRQLLYAFD